MAASDRTIDVHIIAESHPLWKGAALSVVVPTLEGYMGILPDHEPILALMGEGTIKVTIDAEHTQSFDVKEGFISFEDNTLTVGIDDDFSA
ncbi:F0F1 ATP synthase subunit epsilon [Alloscardovia omnicolens]|uniref:F0F1 ATP synthase subunit epsilon n=1 Tax=Alloscardovia omnicolens TaxID=419015 RepID=UPI003A744DB8